MKIMGNLLGAFTILSLSVSAFAAVSPTGAIAPTLDKTKWTAEEQRDGARYPNMMHFVKTVNISLNEDTPAGNEHLLKTKRVFRPGQDLWTGFFKAAVADKLTNIRAFALIARELKNRNLAVFGPGRDYEDAVKANKVDLGLSLPAKNIGLGVWQPDSTIKDPEFLLHLSIVYTERFVHQFPDEVLPANLKIGFGDEIEYGIDGKKLRGYLMTADLYYGEHGIGFKNVHGVGGQKRGVLGFFQKVLFFLPDAVHSMMIDERKNAMVTEALVNTTVDNFETRDVYRMHYLN